MNRRNQEFYTLCAIILLLAAYFAAGWLAAPCSDVLSKLGSIIAILLISRILGVINRKMLTGSSLLPPLFYAFLVAAHPGAYCFSMLHVVAILLAVSIYSYLGFNALGPSLSRMASMWLTLGCAGLLMPPLMWLAPVFALTSVAKSEDKLKFWFIALFGLAIPTAIWLGVFYLMGDTTPVDSFFVEHYGKGMTAVQAPTFYHSTPTLCRIAIVAVVTLVAMVRILSQLTTYKTSQYHACLRCIVLTLCLSVLTLLFWGDTATPAGLLLLLPVAPLLGLYFENARNKTASTTLLIILALILIAERVSCFV